MPVVVIPPLVMSIVCSTVTCDCAFLCCCRCCCCGCGMLSDKPSKSAHAPQRCVQIGNSQEAEKAFAHSIKTRGDHNSAVSMRMVSHVEDYVLFGGDVSPARCKCTRRAAPTLPSNVRTPTKLESPVAGAPAGCRAAARLR